VFTATIKLFGDSTNNLNGGGTGGVDGITSTLAHQFGSGWENVFAHGSGESAEFATTGSDNDCAS
jgi:hypothetical protein